MMAWQSGRVYTRHMQRTRSTIQDSAPITQRVDAVARWFMLIGLATYLIFCHGCHGDKDNELFAVVKQQVTDAALP